MRDRTAFLLLLGACALVRMPFLRAFDLVAYDGVYYINQARSMLGMSPDGGAFPLGYPVFIAALLPIVRDGVRAAQIVSVAAGVGTVWVLYILAARIVSRPLAFVAALALAITPLFIRLSMMTLSESIFVFWVLLAFYFFRRGKELSFAFAMGMATVTRPEAVGIFTVLLLWRARSWRRLGGVLVVFAGLYTINVGVLSVTTGRFVLLPKTEFFGTSAERWQGREAWVDFPGKEDYEQVLETGRGSSVAFNAMKRLPGEFLLLGRHVMPVALVLALFGVIRKRLFLLAGFVPFVFYPFFTVRSESRYVFPYVPFVLLYALLGVEAMRERQSRALAVCLLVASAAAGLIVNREELVTPVSDGFQWAKKAGLEWRERIRPGDRVADRKPFFAFYSDAVYTPIPIAPYEDAVEHLVREDVRLLMLHRATIEPLRPAFMPLLVEPEFIRGELRFRQVDVDPGVYALYERTGVGDTLERRRITPQTGGVVVFPGWSPDGRSIAFRTLEPAGDAGIHVIPAEGGEPRRMAPGPALADPVSWSPDSKRVAFAVPATSSQSHVASIDVSDGTIDKLTTGEAFDRSPSWSRSGREIVFVSNRTGSNEIWSVDTVTREEIRITTGGSHAYPALSPSGDRIAWIDASGGLVLLDRSTGRRVAAKLPKKISFAPSWSPDGRFIAVTAEAEGGVQIYILTSDGGEALRLTQSTAGNGMPSWSPDGARLMVVTNENRDYGLWVLSGIEPYLERLLSPVPVTTVGARD